MNNGLEEISLIKLSADGCFKAYLIPIGLQFFFFKFILDIIIKFDTNTLKTNNQILRHKTYS